MLETVIEAAQQAGQVIAARYPAERSLSFKGYRDLVTEADVAAEATVLDVIRARFPHHAVLSEEAGGGRIGDGYTWVVDPLDGTTNFAHRLPVFAVSIGVLKQGKPELGAIHDPLRAHTFEAERGGGARLNGEPMHVSRVASLREAVVGLDWARSDQVRTQVLAYVCQVASRCHTVRVLGSATLGLAYVGAGWLDAYFHLALHPWDAAAGVLIVAEAGGRCTTLAGEAYGVGSPACLATNGLIHEQLLDVLGGA